MFKKKHLLLVVGDVCIIMLAIVTSYIIRLPDAPETKEGLISIFRQRTGATSLTVAIYLCFLYILNNYYFRRDWGRVAEYWTVIAGTALASLMLAAVFYLTGVRNFGRGIYLLQFAIITLGVSLTRFIVHAGYRRVQRVKNFIIVGISAAARALAKEVCEIHDCDHCLTAFVDPFGLEPISAIDHIPVHKCQPSLLQLALDLQVDSIVIALTNEELSTPSLMRQILECKVQGLRVSEMPAFYKYLSGKVPIAHVNEKWFVLGGGFDVPARPVLRNLLRMIDVCVSITGLIATLGFWPLIAFLIKVTSPGPVFYRQARCGIRKQPFTLLKFRSMRQNAEPNGAMWAQGSTDPRVTGFGRLLRRTRLDELPQLLNILKGDMSIVGPRPERPELVEMLEREIPFYDLRFAVRPGLTGWAQVNFGYAGTTEQASVKLQFDLYYIQENSLLLNLSILLRTIPTVIFKAGS